MTENKKALNAPIDKSKSDEELDFLKKMEEQEKSKGDFAAIKDDLHERDKSLKKKKHHSG